MSFDKIKAMRSAERYLSQGKIRAAIGEYKQIVENDSKDFSTLNILGDLYAKNDEKKQAVWCFTRVAEHYSKQGFAQKAIAVYNKISRIHPGSLEISTRLAELYQIKGSFAEARSHYVLLAEQYQRDGKKVEALQIWKQIASLDPNNTEVFLKIAESYRQDDQKDDAAEAFTAAGQRLSDAGKHEAALAAFSQALELRQNDFKALNGFVKTQISLGCADEAAMALEEILEKQPYNRDILYLLADCHLETGNPALAEKAVVRLVEQEPANYPKFLELIEAFLQKNDLDSASRILSMSSEHLLVGGQSEEFLKWTNEILARNPEQTVALRLLVRYHGWQRDEAELKLALERLAEAARHGEAFEDERYALAHLVLIDPQSAAYEQRLQEINHKHGLADDFETEPLIAIGETEPAETDKLKNFVVAKTAAEQDFLTAEFDGYETASGLTLANGFHSAEADASNENGAKVQSEKAQSEKLQTKKPETDSGKLASQSAKGKKRSATSPLSAAEEVKLDKEIEGIEFYIEQGYQDLAEKSLDALEAEFGSLERFAALRARINSSPQTFVEELMPQVEIIDDADYEEKAAAASVSISQNYNFDDFRSELGLEEIEASDDNDYETHYQMAVAYQEMGLMEEAIKEFQDAINLVTADDSTRRFFQCAHLLGHCFMEKQMPNLALMWYRRALESKNLNDCEKQGVWYEIGNAYESGGDPEKALENFEMIYAVNVDYRDVGERIQNLHVSS